MVGLEIGSWTLTSKIGEGGMGEVWVAQHKLLPRKAAVKLLLKQFTTQETIVKRFINEARATSQIVHPNIIRIFDFGALPDGATYMLMEFLEGEVLKERIRRRGRLPLAEAVAIARQMAEGLAAAHAQKVVHRDLKPDNVFIVKDETAPNGERVKILDFGIAKMLDPEVSGPHTKTGSVLGTPLYMSPEQCRALPTIDHRADLYSLGAVFFALLCGRPPFEAAGVGELLGAHVYTPAPAPSSVEPSVPRAFDALVLKLLAKEPAARYQSMGDLVAALDWALAHPDDVPAFDVAGPEASTLKPRVPSAAAQPAGGAPAEAAPKSDTGSHKAVDKPVKAAKREKRETTTLGGATGEKQRAPNGLPQLERPKRSPVVMMAVAFGVTAALALGGFLLLSGGSKGPGDPAPAPTTAGRPPETAAPTAPVAPAVPAQAAPTPTPTGDGGVVPE